MLKQKVQTQNGLSKEYLLVHVTKKSEAYDGRQARLGLCAPVNHWGHISLPDPCSCTLCKQALPSWCSRDGSGNQMCYISLSMAAMEVLYLDCPSKRSCHPAVRSLQLDHLQDPCPSLSTTSQWLGMA